MELSNIEIITLLAGTSTGLICACIAIFGSKI